MERCIQSLSDDNVVYLLYLLLTPQCIPNHARFLLLVGSNSGSISTQSYMAFDYTMRNSLHSFVINSPRDYSRLRQYSMYFYGVYKIYRFNAL